MLEGFIRILPEHTSLQFGILLDLERPLDDQVAVIASLRSALTKSWARWKRAVKTPLP